MKTPEAPDSGSEGATGRGKNVIQDFGPFLTLGLQLAVSVVVFFFIGFWLDGRFGTFPWCSVGGGFLGAVGGMIKFLKDATALGKRADEEYRELEKKEERERR